MKKISSTSVGIVARGLMVVLFLATWCIVIVLSIFAIKGVRYKSQVAEQIEERVAPLEKKIKELQDVIIEEGNLRHAQTEILDKVIGCMEKLEAKGARK